MLPVTPENSVHGGTLPGAANRDYSRQWRVYAFRRRVALLLLFGWLPVSAGGFLLSRSELHVPWLMLSLIVVWGITMCWAVWYAGEFRCPRCRRRFGALGSRKGPGVIWRGLFDRICYNCKLQKFENV